MEISYKMSNESLLKKIKKARILKELKQKDIAKKLNVSIPTYSRFERGITKTDYNLIKEVCSILDLDFYSLENDDVDIFSEDGITYDTKTSLEISSQLKTLIILLEKQQQTNAIILKNLKSFTSKKS
ncbi:MAG: helix-turn-helix transcriptional regulator [Flavobacteriales bacterium]|nr:helix-turn-helix transcriptional regulator [Flavobacteriales bacterium]